MVPWAGRSVENIVDASVIRLETPHRRLLMSVSRCIRMGMRMNNILNNVGVGPRVRATVGGHLIRGIDHGIHLNVAHVSFVHNNLTPLGNDIRVTTTDSGRVMARIFGIDNHVLK